MYFIFSNCSIWEIWTFSTLPFGSPIIITGSFRLSISCNLSQNLSCLSILCSKNSACNKKIHFHYFIFLTAQTTQATHFYAFPFFYSTVFHKIPFLQFRIVLISVFALFLTSFISISFLLIPVKFHVAIIHLDISTIYVMELVSSHYHW